MRKILTAILCSLLLPAGVAMAMTAGDRKEDKKEDKDKEKENKPVVIIIWQPSWPPIFELTGSSTNDDFGVFSFGMEE